MDNINNETAGETAARLHQEQNEQFHQQITRNIAKAEIRLHEKDRMDIAAHAMAALISTTTFKGEGDQWRSMSPALVAESSVLYADALLAELAKPKADVNSAQGVSHAPSSD